MTKVDRIRPNGPKWTEMYTLDQIKPKWTEQDRIKPNGPKWTE